MNLAPTLVSLLFSILVPQKMYFTAEQPINVTVQSDKDVTLELVTFSGKVAATSSDIDAKSHTIDLRAAFPQLKSPGTLVVYAVPKGATEPTDAPPKDFVGTPIVVEVLANKESQEGQAKPMLVHIVPLRYAAITTDQGKMTAAFYYDVAPHTDDVFLRLASEGFYDGLVFHRIVPNFVIQGGDPLGNDADPNVHGTGGPGFNITAEFNDRPHEEGVLSMARSQSPDSGGSQFFICLDYANTKQLDHKYTAFGKIVDGMDTVKKIAATKVNGETPVVAPVIQRIEVLPVAAGNNPYEKLTGGK